VQRSAISYAIYSAVEVSSGRNSIFVMHSPAIVVAIKGWCDGTKKACESFDAGG
jgi:hypothetical protein